MSEENENKDVVPAVVEYPAKKVWLDLPAVSACPPDFRAGNRYSIRFANAIYGGNVDILFKIRLRISQDEAPAKFQRALFGKQFDTPVDLHQAVDQKLNPEFASWVIGQHLNPDGTTVPMMRLSRKDGSPEQVAMPTLVPAFKAELKHTDVTITLPYRTLVGAKSASHAIQYGNERHKYITFYQSVLDTKGRMCLVVGLKPRIDPKKGVFETPGVLALLDANFVKRLEILHRELQKALQEALKPGGLIHTVYGLYEEKGRGHKGLTNQQQIDPKKVAALTQSAQK